MKKQAIAQAMIAGFLSLVALSLHASVDYTEWTTKNMSRLLVQAHDKKQMVLVVVTQPDWCPPCILLENRIIKNPAETEFAALAKDWLAFEIYGYDQEGADFLKAQKLRFHGTPTTFLLDPTKLSSSSSFFVDKPKRERGFLRLGDLKVLHSIAGMPDDFTAQFTQVVNGFDRLAEAQKRVRSEQSIEAYQALASVYIEQGNINRANRVYASLLLRDDLLDEEIAALKWEQIGEVLQRVQKDHARTVTAINEFVSAHPDFLQDKAQFEDYAYKLAWSLVALGRAKEANELLRSAYVAPNDVDGISTYLYFAFRNPDPLLLADAEALSRQALAAFPDSEMRLRAAHGRVLRRLGRLAEARDAFARAVELAVDDAEALETYVGQLRVVEAELGKG